MRTSERIDLGLAVIGTVYQPGQTLNQRDIAAICGCSRSTIHYIEKSALNNLREMIRKKYGFKFGELTLPKLIDRFDN